MPYLFPALLSLASPVLAAEPPKPAPSPPSTRIAILNVGLPFNPESPDGPSGGSIGHEIVTADFEAALPALEAEGIEIVVFLFNASMSSAAGIHTPGTADETGRLVSLIIDRYNPRFRTVAWVDSALDTAAVAAWSAEELYFVPDGVLGAAVLETAPLQAAKGDDLAAWLALGERASRAGGHDPAIIRSMQDMVPLSAAIRRDGTVFWANDLSGPHRLNEAGSILTIDSTQAERFKISRGTVATRRQLATALGVPDPVWRGADASRAIDANTQKRAAPAPE